MFYKRHFEVCNTDFMRPPLRGHGPHGELRLHAAAPELQTPEPGLRRREKEELHHPHFSSSATSMFRLVKHFLVPTLRRTLGIYHLCKLEFATVHWPLSSTYIWTHATSTRSFQEVFHPSSDLPQWCLPSVLEWELVYPCQGHWPGISEIFWFKELNPWHLAGGQYGIGI